MSPPSLKPVFSTLSANSDPAWDRVVDVAGIGQPLGGVKDLYNLWTKSRGRKALILRGSVTLGDRYRDLILVLLMRFRRNKPTILITDATWQVSSASLAKRFPWLSKFTPGLLRLFIRLIDGPHVIYAVLSNSEKREFPNTWKVDPVRVVFTPFSHTLWGEDADLKARVGDYLFSGGESLRDYKLLERALDQSSFETHIAAAWQSDNPRVHAGRVSHAEFIRLMADCYACVVPIADDVRSAGQQTYLNAMALGKPVIVTDSPGVRDYLEHGKTGFIAPAEPSALKAQIDWVMNPANRAAVMDVAAAGQKLVHSTYTEYEYRRRLLDVVGCTEADENP